MAASNAHVSLTTVQTTFWAEWHFREEKRRCLVTSSCCPCCTPHVSADGGASRILGIPVPSPSEPRTISQEAQLIPRRKRCAQSTTPGSFHDSLANPRLHEYSARQLRTVTD